MKINWTVLEEKFVRMVEKPLVDGVPSYHNARTSFSLLQKAAFHRTGSIFLDGLPKILFPALEKALISEVGEIGPLREISVSLESFLQRLLIINNTETNTGLAEGYNLMPGMKSNNLNSRLSNPTGRTPYFKQENLESFKGQDEYLHELCDAYLTRNKIHNSPDWNQFEVITKLRNILIVYSHSVLKYETEINALTGVDEIDFDAEMSVENAKMLYDFISFSKATEDIKLELVEAYILHKVHSLGTIAVHSLRDALNTFFNQNFPTSFVDARIKSLEKDDKVDRDLSQRIFLTKKANEDIDKNSLEFNSSKRLFLSAFDNVISPYNIGDKRDEILKRFTKFLKDNYSADVEMISDAVNTEYDEISNLDNFLSYLESHTNSRPDAENIFKELIECCKSNDFLIRVSASEVFTKITSTDRYLNYVKSKKRVIYLDTQIVLYTLLLEIDKNFKYDNIFYKITKDLFKLRDDNPGIEFRFSKFYLSEIIYQIRAALLVSPFEEFNGGRLTNNIFYQYYYEWKNLNQDNQNTSFSNFLKKWFNVGVDDVYDLRFYPIVHGILSTILQDDMGVKLVSLPQYPNLSDIGESVFKQAALKDEKLRPKFGLILNNDAKMLVHLSVSEISDFEPFFLTWDRAFFPARSLYLSKYKRESIIDWNLFSPARFINHINLLHLKIDVSSLNDSFLSIIDSYNVASRTATIWDSFSKLTDVSELPRRQRNNYITILRNIFNDEDFNYYVDDSLKGNVIEEDIIARTFESIIDQINSVLRDFDQKENNVYRDLMKNEDYFQNVSNLIKEESKFILENGRISYNMKKNIIQLMDDYSNK